MKTLSFSNCPLDPTLGSGKTRLAWAAGLRGLGHDVENWDVVRLLRPLDRRLGFRLGLAFSARRAIARADLAGIDLVEFFGVEFWWATRWLRRRKRRPLIVAHTDGFELLAYQRLGPVEPKARGRLERWAPFFDLGRRSVQAFADADRFVALCRLDTEDAVRRGLFTREQAATVSPGLDAEYLGRPFVERRDDTVVVFGSWVERKGVGHVAAVINRFLAAHASWRLLIVGASGQEAAIRAAIGGAFAARIEVAPKLPVAEIGRRLDRAKILFSASEYEGFGLAIAEAMGCGCAAVVTPTGFGGDLVPGVDAQVCGFGDEDAMFATLHRLAGDDETRERIARAGWHRVQSLAWPEAVRHLAEIYLRWLGERSS